MFMDKFEVAFYAIDNGNSSVFDFLEKLSERARSKVVRQLKYVQEFGLTPAVPNIKKVAGHNFWELRILGKDNIRLFCIQKGTKVIMIYAFNKKQKKLPLKN